jgi:hypothetical protein
MKKTKPRRQPLRATIDMSRDDGGPRLKIDEDKIFEIHAGKSKHGPRKHWREWEYAQVAVQSLYGTHPPKNIDRSKLTRDVNDWLNRNTDYRSTGLGAISRNVILRVLKDLWKRSP